MTDSPELNKFLNDYGFKPKETWGEIRELPSLIHSGELCIAILEGQLLKIHGRSISGIGILALTNKRAIFFRKSVFGTITLEEIPLSKITSISYRKGLVFASICIITSNNEALIDYCTPVLAKTFTEILQQKLNEKESSTTVKSDSGFSQLDEIDKLFNLMERGALTDEEFTQLKRKILGL